MFRLIAVITFGGCVAISAIYRRRARRESETIPRRRERPPLVIARVVIGLPLFLGVLTYLVHPGLMSWSSLDLPDGLRWVGASLGLLCVPTAYWVFSTIGQNVSETVLTKDGHELITAGPYHWVRHPLYTVGVTLFGAVGLMAANWFVLLFAAITLLAIRLVVIPLEERELVARFGDAYREYVRRTGALLPRPWGGR